MTFKRIGSVYAVDGKKKKNGALNLALSLIIAGVFLYFAREVMDWWREVSPPARYVENHQGR